MPPVESIHAHAADDLRFIRQAMERAGSFTALPGRGGVWMGVSALVAAFVSGPPDNTLRWVLIWLGDAVVAVVIGFMVMTRKARRSGLPLTAAPTTPRFALAFVPPLVAGMILTPVFATLDLVARLPGCWGHWFMAAGFGGLHIVSGTVIARESGG